ncbi:MAG: hypothetical protein AAB152_03125 [Candidatus Coatesbacteria bacterium]
MPNFLRVALCALALTLPTAVARAIEGAPPFEVLPAGRPVAELTAEVGLAPEAGLGGGFLHGAGERSLRVKSYAMIPFGARYGLWQTLEVWGVIPLVWGSSPQQYVNVRTGGAPETYRATLSGFDGSDVGAGLRWEPWSSDDGSLAVVLTAGVVIPLGTNVWQNSQFNFPDSFGTPDLASGDGAWKMLTAVEGIWDTEAARVSVLAGYLLKFPQEATALEPPASTITVTLPAPVVGWVRPAWKLSEDSWLTARVDGFWARQGTIGLAGLLTRTPEALPAVLDSYQNLLEGSWGIWAGIGMRQALTPSSAASCEVCAPVFARNLYRLWRVVAAFTWTWKP